QLYGVKWARLLFGREFPMSDVLILWDHIFASSRVEGGPNVPLCVEHVAVAMILNIRSRLMSADPTGCLQLLMRYPPPEDVHHILFLALSL
ncbi:unnamed protein product, partial [Discosporangium mesarthrocarpum]